MQRSLDNINDDDQRRGVHGQGAPGHLAWVYFGAVHRALEQLLERQHAMAGIEKQRSEDLVRPAAQALGEIAARRVRIADGVATRQRRVQQAGAQFQCRGQHAGTGRTERGQRGQFGRRALEQGAQRAVVGEQLAGGGDRVAPTQAGAQEEGQQLGVAEARRAAGQQLFTGTFVLGPVADVHVAILDGQRTPRHRGAGGVRVS